MLDNIESLLRVFRRILFVLLSVVLLAVVAALAVFQGEIRTLLHIRQLTDRFFIIDIKSDYALSDFMERGAKNDAELAEFIIKKTLKGLPVTLKIPKLGCSTFNARTPGGEYLFGRNFDNYDAQFALVHTRPRHGYESISMVDLSFVGFDRSPFGRALALSAPYLPLDGMNEKGLAVAVLQLHTAATDQNTEKPDITTTSAIRILLDTCATVTEAIECLSRYDMHSSAHAPYHFQLADASGDSATVEYLDDKLTVVRNPHGSLCTTNFVLAPGAYFNHGKGQSRHAALTQALEKTGGIATEDGCMALLSSVQMTNARYVNNKTAQTLWSAVYNNSARTVALCCNRDYATVYRFSVTGKRGR